MLCFTLLKGHFYSFPKNGKGWELGAGSAQKLVLIGGQGAAEAAALKARWYLGDKGVAEAFQLGDHRITRSSIIRGKSLSGTSMRAIGP